MAFLFGDTVKLLENHHIYSRVCDLVAKAESEIVIVSPYLDPTESLLRDLKRVAATGASVEVVFRADKLDEYRKKKWLSELVEGQIQVGTLDLLHSKLYVSEKEAILTSMNLLNSSKDKSHEVGIVVSEGADLYDDIREYLDKSVNPYVQPLPSSAPPKERKRYSKRTKAAPNGSSGACISCGKSIKLDQDRPYCGDHWRGDPDGEVCHVCGRAARTTREKPACYSCFKAGALR